MTNCSVCHGARSAKITQIVRGESTTNALAALPAYPVQLAISLIENIHRECQQGIAVSLARIAKTNLRVAKKKSDAQIEPLRRRESVDMEAPKDTF